MCDFNSLSGVLNIFQSINQSISQSGFISDTVIIIRAADRLKILITINDIINVTPCAANAIIINNRLLLLLTIAAHGATLMISLS